MRPVQYALNQEIVKIRADFIEKLEDMTGIAVHYSSMRPSLFGSFNINNLSFIKEDTPLFTVSRIKIHFSIMELLLHKKTFIHTVQIDSPEISLDTVKDADTFDFIMSFINNGKDNDDKIKFQQITEFLPSKADYQIRHLNFNLTDKKTVYKIENMNLNVKEKNGEIILSGRFYAELRKSGLYDKIIILSADADINGVCYADLEKGSAELSIAYMACSEQNETRKTVSFFRILSNNSGGQRRLFNLLPFKAVLSYNDHLINVKPESEDGRNNYYFNCNTESGGIQAGIKLEDFKLERLINFSEYFKTAADLFSMQITGDLLFVSENSVMSYNVNLKGGDNDISSINKDSFIIDVYGNEKGINVKDFFFTSANSAKDIFFGSFGLSGNLEFFPLLSQGTVYFDRFSLTGKENLNAVFNISNHEEGVLISGGQVEIAQTMINKLEIFLYPMEKEMGIGVSGFFPEGGAIFLDAVFNVNPVEVESSLTIDSLSLFEITEIFRPFSEILSVPAVSRGMLKKSSVNTDIFFSTDFNNIVYSAPNIVFSAGNVNGLLSLSGTDRQITLSEGILFQGETELIFSSNVNFSNPMDLAFTLNAGYQDISWRIDGQILNRNILIIRDPNGFRGYGNISNNGSLSGYIEGVNYPILANSRTIYLNFYTSLRYDSFDFWSLDINNFTARYANADDGADFFKISGVADQKGANLREIFYTDSTGMLTGSADFSWNTDFSYLDFVMNITDGREAGEYYYAKGALENDNISVDISVSDMYVNRFIKASYPVTVSGDAAISWNSIDLFNANINLSSLRTRIRDNAVYTAVNVNFSNDELFIKNFRLDYAGLRANLPELIFNRAEGIARAKADINGVVLHRNVEGNIEFNADFNHIDSWLNLDQIYRNFNGRLLVDNFTYGDIKDEVFNMVFSGNEGVISVKGGDRDMIRLEIDDDGNFFTALSAPMPIRGNIVGTLKNGIMNAHTNYFFIDITSLFNIFSVQNEFLVTGGYITGETDLIGPFWNPEFHGTAKAASMRFQVPNYIKEDIRIAPFDVLAEGYEMTFGPVTVLSGNGSGTANGWFNFENWSPVNIGLDISIPREYPVSYGINIAGFLADGIASGNLNITIDANNLLMGIKGELFSNEAELGINTDEIINNKENEGYSDIVYNAVIDLKITAGSMVKFVWPAASPILKASPEMGTVILITSDTQTAHFSLNSNIKIRSGELYYFDRSFFIRQGSIVFKENETKFDPRISARAEIRDRSDSGPVTISMIIENQPLFSFEPRFEASPGMTQLEIYSILGQTFNSIQGEENPEVVQRFLLASTTDLVAQYIASSDFLSQFVFLRQFERNIRNFIRMDMFSVRTRFVQNVFVLAGTSGLSQMSGQTPVDSNNQRVGNYLDNTTVFIGKYIGQNMFVQGMITLKYDETSNILGGTRIEPDIGIELQSPFINRWNFNIRWNFFPDPFRWENYGMDYNSITLNWSKSF
jgi:hypothetical protein